MNPQQAMTWGSALAASLPRSVAEQMSDSLATVAAALPSGGLRHLRDNLLKVLPDVPRAVVRGAVRSYGRYYLGMMRLSHADVTTAVGPLSWHGDEHMLASLQRGRGAVVLSAHVGNWDLAGMALAQRFGDMTVYVERLRPAGVLEFYRRTRKRHGCEVVEAGSGSRAALRTLRRNGIVGIVADRSFGAPAVRVPFGRGELDVPIGGIRLALHQQAALHSIFCIRGRRGYECHLQPELLLEPPAMDKASAQDAVRAAAAEFAQRLQALVQQHPDQWCLMYPTLTGQRGDA